jgi:hypothetical protein
MDAMTPPTAFSARWAAATLLDILQRPLAPARFGLSILGAGVAVTAYCLAYTAYDGAPESVGEAGAWTLVNVLPWLAAVEVSKRSAGRAGKAAVLLAAAAVSIALGYLVGAAGTFGFELVRRVPYLIACGFLAALASCRRPERKRVDALAAAELPAFLEVTEWISSAGNYVELHGGERSLIHRSSLGSLEAQLGGHGFVRIHRCTLVRCDIIARVRSADVVLKSGAVLRTGKRYRSALGTLKLVPSSQTGGD